MNPGMDGFSFIGNSASVLGLVVSLFVFAWTLKAVAKAERVAEGAKQAAEKARAAILKSNSMVELATAIREMDEIKKFHRDAIWVLLPDRYARLRASLLTIRTMMPTMSDEHKGVFQSAIQQFREMENIVERALVKQGQPPDVARLNKLVSLQVDKLIEVLTMMRVGKDG